MARTSKKHDMTTLSAFLFVAVVGFVAWTVDSIRRGHIHAGIVQILWALVFLSFILFFTWPTRCRVITTSGKPCRRTAYGFLFGCSGYFHWWPKFFARIGLQKDALRQVERHRPGGNTAATHQLPLEEQPIRVSVEDTGLSICGFWVGVVGALAGVVQVILAIH
jgi:hypothetical protein